MSKASVSARRALVILCVVFFLIPFGVRGAKHALRNIKNDPNDWLPSDFPETVELKWFGKHFVGEKFVVITWPACSADDQAYKAFIDKLSFYTQPSTQTTASVVNLGEDAAAEPAEDVDESYPSEAERARMLGDRLGLFFTGDYKEDWGDRGEKWLLGKKDQWYFITPDGELYRWTGGMGLPELTVRAVQRGFGHKKAKGEKVAQVGGPTTDTSANPYHKNPRLLTARRFASISTGPQLLAELSSPQGPLWPSMDYGDEDKPFAVRALAYERLTGSLFGNSPVDGIQWTEEDFRQRAPAEKLKELPDDWQEIFTVFVEQIVLDEFDDDIEKLRAASLFHQEFYWGLLFDELGVEPPSRQTCIIATLNDVAKADLAKVVGRPLLGKPRGLVLALAQECSVSTDEKGGDLRLGGPPVDNVAIDEEGTRTLVKLVGFSALLGFLMSFLCFRSVVVTIMVFVVGGVSAIAGLAFVFYSGQTVDAILMSMPAVVYVLGLSGAVHIVNYYRDSLKDHSPDQAPWVALRIGWWPCTIAASTTAIGLISLYLSNIVPIAKFGLFSALGVLGTLVMLFAYLPSALVTWPPGFKPPSGSNDGDDEQSFSDWLQAATTRFWLRVGGAVVHHHRAVAFVGVFIMIGFVVGLFRINTSVKLMELFDPNAKIIADYHWLEANLGKLVPMEVIVRIFPERLAETEMDAGDAIDRQLQYSLLERLEITDRIQRIVESHFGPAGADTVGRGVSAATFFKLPPPTAQSTILNRRSQTRRVTNTRLVKNYDQLLQMDYLRRDKSAETRDSELWRISLRIGALNGVDYGEFVHDLKYVVEPVLTAHRYRDEILRKLHESDAEDGFSKKRVVFLGMDKPGDPLQPTKETASLSPQLQSDICFSTLQDLLTVKGFTKAYRPSWHNPLDQDADDLRQVLAQADCVVLTRNHSSYDIEELKTAGLAFIDARDHVFSINKDGVTSLPTAAQRNQTIQAVYTGAVPVIYKAQRTLLTSLINSIAWAFCMIAIVMMLLLRSGKLSPTNIIGVRSGLLSMIPNVFPVVLIFGAMGHLGLQVDIGTMMTASVAMGVAVDDTIHFLIWFRKGIAQGMSRFGAIALAYKHVATAMTQTTLIGGLGLSVFYWSTFTPTQRFGVMMLTLLSAALVGDLIFLPALLAGPLGRFFCPKGTKLKSEGDDFAMVMAEAATPSVEQPVTEPAVQAAPPPPPHAAPTGVAETPHAQRIGDRLVRRDDRHDV
ncbi:MAG: MMPL family transporter [Pirellulaceae bacterium]|nr:MMPL family transporter [Pirellulaceae bacterium]